MLKVGDAWSGSETCTGTKVGATSFLTAAHCFIGVAPGASLTISRGDGEDSHDTRVLALASPPPSADPALYDIAMVRVDDTTPYPVAEISLDEGVLAAGAKAPVYGFGCSDGDQLRVSDSEVLPIAPYVAYREDLRTNPELSPVAALGAITDCEGDSGGPVFDENHRVIGVIFGTWAATGSGAAQARAVIAMKTERSASGQFLIEWAKGADFGDVALHDELRLDVTASPSSR